jgi:hypothetical protein
VSCALCGRAQERRGAAPGADHLVRVGDGDVQVIGCDEHVAETFRLLRLAHASEEADARRRLAGDALD